MSWRDNCAVTISSCTDCKAPIRHVGCHAECKEYIEAKKKYDIEMAKQKKYNNEHAPVQITMGKFIGNCIHSGKSNDKYPKNKGKRYKVSC